VQVADASIRTPDNKIILENLNFHVSPGKWLLLKGYSGAGKTTMLKTLSHCWPWFKGDISSPADSWYVSQTPLRITTPTTSTGGGTTNAQFTYINHGTDYSP
ncbi:ATP-binding cassette domain-containing protein, partial [Escherichia coli]|uniref:ATP-binding cassette domain-containing protein n=1 Tax=Escherichia coli TaxID=562 RepID=UPI0023AF7981